MNKNVLKTSSEKSITKPLDPDVVGSFFFSGKMIGKRRLSTIVPSLLQGDKNPIHHISTARLDLFVLSECGIGKNKIYIGVHSPGSKIYKGYSIPLADYRESSLRSLIGEYRRELLIQATSEKTEQIMKTKNSPIY